MKFAHMSDCHLGGWRDPQLESLGMQCFQTAIDTCIQEKVDFILISGDLFDSSRPSIEVMEKAVTELKKAKDEGIEIYVIEGSHDFSPTGKTILRVFEKAGLFRRVSKGKRAKNGKLQLVFTKNKKTGVKIVGLVGRKGVLERSIYEELDREHLQQEKGFKIFMFHTGLDELKPDMFEHADTMPASLLPLGFDYYAGGHIHQYSEHQMKDYPTVVYPGPIFPTNFKELENLESGGFNIVISDEQGLKVQRKPLKLYHVLKIKIDATGKSPEGIEDEINKEIEEAQLKDKIVLLRVEGVLGNGKPSDINFQRLISSFYEKGAQLVKKKVSGLVSKEFKEIKIGFSSRDELEDKLIKEHVGQHKLGNLSNQELIKLTKNFMKTLAQEKELDETNRQYDSRLTKDILSILDITEEWGEMN